MLKVFEFIPFHVVRLVIVGLLTFHSAALEKATAQSENSYTQQPTEILIKGILIKGANLEGILFEHPGSVTVIRPTEVTKRGGDHLQDVLGLVPNLNWAGGTSRPQFFQIRGVGEVEQYEGAPNSSVGVIIDGLDFTSIGAPFTLFDLDQVEVLRGPQATRYGANALAGIISVRTQDPTPVYTGRAQLSLGQDDLFAGGAAIGGAIGGTSAAQFRVSAYQHRSDGFRDNLFFNSDNTNERDEFTGRAKLKLVPDSTLQIDLTGMAIDQDNGYDAFAIDNSLNTQSDRPGQDSNLSDGGSLRIKWDISQELELISTSSGIRSNLDYSYDGDWGNDPFWSPYDPYDYFASTYRDIRKAMQEVRLKSNDTDYQLGETARWNIGLYAERYRENATINNYEQQIIYDEFNSNYVAHTGAVFGEYEQPLFQATALRGGVRLEQRYTRYCDSRENSGGPDDLMWGGNLTLDHGLSDNLNSYLTAARGFKGGGVNASLGVPETSREFQPESIYSFEAGLNSSLLSGQVTTRTAAFAMFRRDIQTRYSFQSDPTDPLTFVYLTDNVARGENLGIEQEVNARVGDRVQLALSGALLDAKFTSVSTDELFLDGRQQSHAPSWQYSATATYDVTQNIFAQINVVGRDGFYFQDSHNEKSSPYNLLGAALGYQERFWRITVWGKNLTDKSYAVRGFFFGNEPPDFQEKVYIQRGDPLQIGATLEVFF